MNLTITQSNLCYVLTTEHGVLRIFNKKNLAWNLRHVFGLSSADMKALGEQLNSTGRAEIKVAA